MTAGNPLSLVKVTCAPLNSGAPTVEEFVLSSSLIPVIGFPKGTCEARYSSEKGVIRLKIEDEEYQTGKYVYWKTFNEGDDVFLP